jgi:hypothetical protein
MYRWTASHLRFSAQALVLALSAVLAGCGTTKSRSATEQLLMSDAVDRAIAVLDFAPLTGKTVFLDTKYLVAVKGIGFVNTEYVTSSLRQQMLASGCLLQEKAEDAEYIVEARIGALGTDTHEITYGIPPSSGLAQATELVPGAPRVPIPDISVAKREDLLGASKVAVFAYHRESKIPVWQSGMSVATSNARDSYILGIGPIQDGTIYHGTHFAGSRWQIPVLSSREESPPVRGLVSYYDEMQFDKLNGPFKIPKKRTPEELNAEIESIVKVPRLSPLTEAMFAAMDAARPPAASPDATADGAAASGGSAPPEASAPAATVAERPKPLPAVSAEAAPDAAPSETAAPATAPPAAQPPSPQPAAEEETTPPPTVTR